MAADTRTGTRVPDDRDEPEDAGEVTALAIPVEVQYLIRDLENNVSLSTAALHRYFEWSVVRGSGIGKLIPEAGRRQRQEREANDGVQR